MNPSKLISPKKNHNYGSILIKSTKGTVFEIGQAQLRQNMTDSHYIFEKEADLWDYLHLKSHIEGN